MSTYAWMQELKFDSMGLIPAIVQDALSGEVLMMAYMNAESLRLSIEENYTCFYSRSRQMLWRKGQTSGNVQKIVSITADCDLDTLLIKVQAAGPACHTGERSCFFNGLHQGEKREDFSADRLYDLIKERKEKLPEGSYTTYLFEKGKEKILKKVGEECSEVIIAAMKNNAEETVYEAADLYYHMLVLLCELGIDPLAVEHELQRRHIIDHKVKQETLRE